MRICAQKYACHLTARILPFFCFFNYIVKDIKCTSTRINALGVKAALYKTVKRILHTNTVWQF